MKIKKYSMAVLDHPKFHKKGNIISVAHQEIIKYKIVKIKGDDLILKPLKDSILKRIFIYLKSFF